MIRNTEINTNQSELNELLQRAITERRVRDMIHLIESGADVNTQDINGNTALSVTCFDTALAKKMIELGVDVNIKNNYDYTALIIATYLRNNELVSLLLQKGADVNIKNDDGNTALIKATLLNNNELVSLLLESGANVNIQDELGDTPLAIACNTEIFNLELATKLIEYKADVNIKNRQGKTALMLACYHKDIERVSFLTQNGADTEIENNEGKTALMIATQYSDIKIIEILAERSKNINKKDINGSTVLNQVAATKSDTEIITVLVKNRADMNAEDNNGITALMKARDHNNIAMIEALIANGVDVNYRNKDGKTALINALRSMFQGMSVPITKLLINAGADFFIRDNNGNDIYQQIIKNTNDVSRFKWILDFHAGLVREIKILGNLMKYITGFFGRIVGNVSEEQQLPLEIQKYIIGFSLRSNIIAPKIIDKFINNFTKEGLEKWKDKEPGAMIRELITDKIQIDYRERITQEQKEEGKNLAGI